MHSEGIWYKPRVGEVWMYPRVRRRSGRESANQGEHRSIQHGPDTEREPGIEQGAASSRAEETGTVHRSTRPYDHHNRPLAESSVGRIKPEGYPCRVSPHTRTTEKEPCTRQKRAGSC